MSYSIIFSQHLIKVGAGRLLLASREGCNNDDVGRRDDEFQFILYNSEADYIKAAARYSGDFENHLKLNGRWITYSDYGIYLLNKLKRAKPADRFEIRAKKPVSVYVKETDTTYPNRDFDKVFYEIMRKYQTISYWVKYEHYNDIGEIIKQLEAGEHLMASVRKKSAQQVLADHLSKTTGSSPENVAGSL